MSVVREHSGAIVWSVALHVGVATALTVGVRLPARPRVAVAPAPIQGMIVDQSVLTREIERREQVQRQETERRQRAERQEREKVEAARRAEQRQQQERVAAEQRERQRVEQEERERVAAAKREQERVAQEQREREAQQAREREAAAAARQQAQMETELQRALAAENERRAAEQAGLLDQYIRLIENQIERNWIAPASARTGLRCVVNVVQIPSGDVIDVRVGQCNGDDAVRRSIETAVRRASPLPKPPHPSLFERNLNVTFQPDL
jgi:colicin import membrane protein